MAREDHQLAALAIFGKIEEGDDGTGRQPSLRPGPIEVGQHKETVGIGRRSLVDGEDMGRLRRAGEAGEESRERRRYRGGLRVAVRGGCDLHHQAAGARVALRDGVGPEQGPHGRGKLVRLGDRVLPYPGVVD